MVSIQVNRSGYHFINMNSSGRSLNFKRKNFERNEGYSDISVCVASTKRIVRNIIHNQSFERTSFLTLTFKDDKFSNYSLAVYEFTNFIRRLNYYIYRTKKASLKYLAVPELQKRGVWHFHIVLFDVPFIPVNTIQEIWGLGFCKINKVNDINHLSNYVLKYITKSLYENISKYKKKILTSKNLDKGLKIFGLNSSPDIDVAIRYLYSQTDLRLVCSLEKEIKKENRIIFQNLFEIYFSENFYEEFRSLFNVKDLIKKYRLKILDDYEKNKNRIDGYLGWSIEQLVKENLTK